MPESSVPPDLAAQIRERLQAKHEARERALPLARRAVRSSANAIRALHRDDRALAQSLIGEARTVLDEAAAACAEQPEVTYAGFLQDAQKEYVEACTTDALVNARPLPTPGELGVNEAAWLNGLAEAVGELRRRLLDELRAGRLDRSEALLAAMDDIISLLATMDFPDAVTSGLRRSTDVARSISERTRGDLTSALVQARLREALEAHRRALG